MDDHRAKVHALIRSAQLQGRDENDGDRSPHALGTLLVAEREAEALVDGARNALERYMAGRRQRWGEALAREQVPEVSDKGKGKQREVFQENENARAEAEEFEDDSDDEDGVQLRRRFGGGFEELVPLFSRVYGDGIDLVFVGAEDEATTAMALLAHDATRNYISVEALPILDDAGLLSILETYSPSKGELKGKPHKVAVHKRVRAEVDLGSPESVLGIGATPAIARSSAIINAVRPPTP
ncbi:hypothetical protein FPV67DRAFT_1670840 [Lyophyllum atratum]|nr:hypothetical protein FPV67DRAFT_1670840 [Lyophyllum atratum]